MAAAVAEPPQVELSAGGVPETEEATPEEVPDAATEPFPPIVGVRPKFGRGREELSNGYYQGSFRYGKRDGEGLLVTMDDGTESYKGQFRDEFMDGKGCKTWADGTVYEGEWKQGRKHGEGVLREPSGRSYSGQWRDGKRHGAGVQIFDSQTRYEGRWENGMHHGTGKYFDARLETVYEGQWSRGTQHGPGLLRGRKGFREKQAYCHGALTMSEVLPPPVEFPPLPASEIGAAAVAT